MPSTHDPHPVQREAESEEFVWKQIRIVLEEKRDRICNEIANYPPPISDCDEQFNYLLEERGRVSRELARVDAAASVQLSIAACRKFLDELVASSDLISDEAAQRLRSYLHGGVS